MVSFFSGELEHMIFLFGGEVRYIANLTHLAAIPRPGAGPTFFVRAPLSSTARDRQLRQLLMGELLRLTDIRSLCDTFRQLYDLPIPASGMFGRLTPDADEVDLIHGFGGSVDPRGDRPTPRAVPRDGAAPLFVTTLGLPARAQAQQLRDLLMGELLARVDRDSLIEIYRALYAPIPARQGGD